MSVADYPRGGEMLFEILFQNLFNVCVANVWAVQTYSFH